MYYSSIQLFIYRLRFRWLRNDTCYFNHVKRWIILIWYWSSPRHFLRDSVTITTYRSHRWWATRYRSPLFTEICRENWWACRSSGI